MTKEPKPGCIFVVIEIPRGSRNKYEIDHHDNRVYLDRRLFTATTYPADYGFVPDTLGGDGDPLDALVLLDDPVYPGVWVEARPVGVLYMQDEAGEDAKLICVPPGEPRWADVHDISHLTPQLMAEIQHFFEVYKALEPDKYSSTSGIGGREDAWREIDEARANFVPRSSVLTHSVRLRPPTSAAGPVAGPGARSSGAGRRRRRRRARRARRTPAPGAGGAPGRRAARRTSAGSAPGRGAAPTARPPPSTNAAGSNAFVRLTRPRATQRANSSIDGAGALVALLGRRLDVLAAHQLDVAAGHLDDAPQPPADRRRPRQLGEAGARRVALPAPPPAARARRAVRVDDHVAELAGEAVGARRTAGRRRRCRRRCRCRA